MDASAGRVLHDSNDADAQDKIRQELLQDPAVAAARRASNTRAHLMRQLVAFRERRNLSQKEVAERMGTTQSAVSDLEKLRTDPRLSTLQRYAEAMGCRLELEIHEDVGRSGEARDGRLREWLSRVHYRSWRNRTLQYEDFSMVRLQTTEEVDLWREDIGLGEPQTRWRPPVTLQPNPVVSVEIRDADELGLLPGGA